MLLLLLPLGLAAWRLLRRGRRSGIRFSATSRLPAKTAGWRAKLASLTPFILIAGLALLIVAAARPRTPLAHDKKSIDAMGKKGQTLLYKFYCICLTVGCGIW